MKNILILIVFFLSYQAFAKSVEVDVLSAEFGVEDHTRAKTLCLTVVRVPQTGALLGVVESIEDCFYARQAKRATSNRITMNLTKLQKLEMMYLGRHLQSMDTQLEFLFSDGE
jgi:prolyl-tRNA editing enzyme YbaK/EbsC (Cys-tRNA(Pro) deacylase)